MSNESKTVYTKTYNLMTKQKWCVATCDCARARTCTYYTNNMQQWYICLYVFPCTAPRPGQTGFFLFFKWSYLEAPTTVLFHSTVIHCWHGINRDRGWLIFRSGMRVTGLSRTRNYIQPEKIEKRSSESNCHEVLKTKNSQPEPI